MKLKLLLSVAFCCIEMLSFADSMGTKKPLSFKKNLLEFNINAINIHGRQGFIILPPGYQFAYTRFLKNRYFARIEFIEYSAVNKLYDKTQSDRKRGDVDYIWFNSLRLNIGHKFEYKKISLYNSISTNYRWGFGESYFWDWRAVWGDPIFNINRMNSFGLGLGSGLFYPIYRNINLGLEYNFHYNFEKYNYSATQISKEESDAFNFKPNRRFSTLQLRLGYRF